MLIILLENKKENCTMFTYEYVIVKDYSLKAAI